MIKVIFYSGSTFSIERKLHLKALSRLKLRYEFASNLRVFPLSASIPSFNISQPVSRPLSRSLKILPFSNQIKNALSRRIVVVELRDNACPLGAIKASVYVKDSTERRSSSFKILPAEPSTSSKLGTRGPRCTSQR